LNLALPSRAADQLGFCESFLAFDRKFVHPHGAELTHQADRNKGSDLVEPAYWSRRGKRPGIHD
jgi:hypothetical protein